MSWLQTLGTVGAAQEARAARAMNEEESQRIMAARRAADAEAVANRQAADAVREEYRRPQDMPGLPEPQANIRWPGPATEAAPAAAPAKPAAATTRRGGLPTPSQATENQSNAESRRLAGKLTTAEAGAQGERPGLRTPALEAAKRNAVQNRFEELKRLNPSVATPNQSAAETNRLNSAAAAAADSVDQNFERFKNAIFGQESGNGRVDTSKPNYAGALGKGQILESTFNGLKQQGKIPASYQWNNPQHNEEAAVAYMREAWQAAGGNPELAAAYYYGGPKAIANGQIATYRDLKNPNAPTTNQYAQQVVQRMGAPLAAAIPSAQAAQPPQAQQQALPATISPQQYTQVTAQLDQDSRLRTMRLDQIQRLMQVTRDVGTLEKLNAEAWQLRSGIAENQLAFVATRAQTGDQQAFVQLAQIAGVPFAQVNGGFVGVSIDPVTGQGTPTTQPMRPDQFVQMLFQRSSAVVKQSMAASAGKIAEQNAETQGAIAVERVKGQTELLKIEANAQRDLQTELAKRQLSADDIEGVKPGEMGAPTLVYTKRGVFQFTPGRNNPGELPIPARLDPVRMQ